MAEEHQETMTSFELENLLLDENNPRFGLPSTTSNQNAILNNIVDTHGVDDVLSSLAVNGYFAAEPIVCQSIDKSEKAIVREGNRRLAACLILTGDDRARDQASRTIKYGALWKEHGSPAIEPVPAILFEGHGQDKAIFSYLGVRHIASAKQWDSYAKAAWVSRVVDEIGLPLDEVASMIGDRHQTVSRMLEGYNFVQQLTTTGKFVPETSVRKGRGSVTEYPFSWIYTILGFTTVRNFLELDNDVTNRNPVPDKNLGKAALVTRYMFGNNTEGRSSAIKDSRQLPDLAAAFASQEQLDLLEQGRTIDQVVSMTKPLDERLRQGFGEMREIQGELIQALAEQNLQSEDAIEIEPNAHRNRNLATELLKRIRDAAEHEDAED
jgi:hypothetical protein